MDHRANLRTTHQRRCLAPHRPLFLAVTTPTERARRTISPNISRGLPLAGVSGGRVEVAGGVRPGVPVAVRTDELGVADGASLGVAEVLALGLGVGVEPGGTDEDAVGVGVGDAVGVEVGVLVGEVGVLLGEAVGVEVGLEDAAVGEGEGLPVGVAVGVDVGASVGDGDECQARAGLADRARMARTDKVTASVFTWRNPERR